jgi:site-specific recombinase XerD
LGISQTKSVLTRLNYAADLYIFFSFLTRETEYFADKIFEDITVEDLNQIKIGDIELYLSWLSSYELDGKALQNGERGKMRKAATLRSFFKYFYRREDINENVLTKIDLPKIHEKTIVRLEDNEVKKMIELSRVNSRDNMILTLFLLSGIRVSELVGLDYGDINLTEGTFRVTRKGGNQTILYMSEQLKERFTEYLKNSEQSAPLHESQSRTRGCSQQQAELCRNKPNAKFSEHDALFQKCGRRISVRAVENIVSKYAKQAAPLKKISPHKLRSTYGTNLYRATGDIYVVADVLGHKDINTTKKHYAAMSNDIRKRAADAVKI